MKNTKLIIALFFIIIGVQTTIFAQVKVGDNPTTINNGSALEVESTNRAFVPPRMTTAQMNNIPSPLVGALVFNTDVNCLHEYKGVVNGWVSFCEPGKYLHLRKTNNQAFSFGSGINTIDWDDTAIINSGGVYTFNVGTNRVTVSETGLYLVTLQVSFTDTPANTQLLAGITNSSNQWVGRGSHYTSNASVTPSIGNVFSYNTVLSLTAGQDIGFGISPNQNATLLGTESGFTGSGNVTNVTILKLD